MPTILIPIDKRAPSYRAGHIPRHIVTSNGHRYRVLGLSADREHYRCAVELPADKVQR